MKHHACRQIWKDFQHQEGCCAVRASTRRRKVIADPDHLGATASVLTEGVDNEVAEFVASVEASSMKIFSATSCEGKGFYLEIGEVDSSASDAARSAVIDRIMAWKKLPDWNERRREITRYLILTGRISQVVS